MTQLNLRLNADNTITIRVNRYVEHISLEGKTHAQIFEAVKWACLSKSAVLSDVAIAEALSKIRWP